MSSTEGKASTRKRGKVAKIKRGSGRQEGVGDKARDKINEEICGSAVAGMLNVAGIFERIIDGFNECSFTK